MVLKRIHAGQLLDVTPRRLLEMLLVGSGRSAAFTARPVIFSVLEGIGYKVKGIDRASRRKIERSFQYLKRHGYLKIASSGKRASLQLTAKGRSRAIRHSNRRKLLLPIKRPPVWDKKWRLIMFDIAADEKRKRNAFRGLIRRLGAVMLQKSVWLFPYDCTEQVELLRDMFELYEKELRIVVAESIGNEVMFRSHFHLV